MSKTKVTILCALYNVYRYNMYDREKGWWDGVNRPLQFQGVYILYGVVQYYTK